MIAGCRDFSEIQNRYVFIAREEPEHESLRSIRPNCVCSWHRVIHPLSKRVTKGNLKFVQSILTARTVPGIRAPALLLER